MDQADTTRLLLRVTGRTDEDAYGMQQATSDEIGSGVLARSDIGEILIAVSHLSGEGQDLSRAARSRRQCMFHVSPVSFARRLP